MGNFLETEETLKKTVEFSKRLKLNDFHVTFLTPLPGSEIYSIAEQYGAFDNNWKKMSMWYPVFVPKGLTVNILEKYRKKALMGFYFRPSVMFSYLLSLRRLSDFTKILKGLRALIESLISKINYKTGG